MLRAFIAMPFHSDLNWIYEIVEESCVIHEIEPVRIDKIAGVENIWEEIMKQIDVCNFLIADFSPDPSFEINKLSSGALRSSANTNVATEAGYAKAKGKPIIIITSNFDSVPFDWKVNWAISYPSDKDANKLLCFKKSFYNKLVALSAKMPQQSLLQESEKQTYLTLLENYAGENLKGDHLKHFLNWLHKEDTIIQLLKPNGTLHKNKIIKINLLSAKLRKVHPSFGTQINLLPDLFFLENIKNFARESPSLLSFFRNIFRFGSKKSKIFTN